MAPQFHEAQVARVLAWLERARASHGSRKPVLAAGRDGVFVPIRGDDSYREAATATLSVYDRGGRRLGTVYLGRMPEPGQGTVSGQLTRLITDVLAGWSGPLPLWTERRPAGLSCGLQARGRPAASRPFIALPRVMKRPRP